ncbi:hypothetical protein, partial [Chitinophaga sp.]|uniref:hypothetical protein n=1 Tax=Chitinophaga sp. TaxID=1869181 RepID=UPI002F93F318
VLETAVGNTSSYIIIEMCFITGAALLPQKYTKNGTKCTAQCHVCTAAVFLPHPNFTSANRKKYENNIR